MTAFWSVGRIVWGVAMLFIYRHDVDLLRPTGSGWSPIVLFLLLVLCEIAPIIVLMDYSFMTIFNFAEQATQQLSSLATGRHILAADGLDEGIIDGNEELQPSGDAPNTLAEPLLEQPA